MAASSDLRIEPMTTPEQVRQAFGIACATFGRQTQDALWIHMNPGWDSQGEKSLGADQMVDRWSNATRNTNGDLNTVFLAATMPRGDSSNERVVTGAAIWVQLSVVDGQGDKPVEDMGTVLDLEAMYPGKPDEQLYLRQAFGSLHKSRIAAVREKATETPPAVLVLDLCVVNPEFQGRGIAKELVKWGIDEAARRGGLELLTEGSPMGRRVYEKLGFHGVSEVVYEVDARFEDRDRPSNLFMRTRPKV